MAKKESPSHKFGQIIGDLVEAAIKPILHDFAQKHNLYLDYKDPRPARDNSKLVIWEDMYGNKHILDYVLEKDGTPQKVGDPVAFIESAWRRYTRHSRNKAQEIQGAIIPLATTHKNVAPFLGAILAGVFTEGALSQLKSRGFHILHFSFESIVEAFKGVGIDAFYDEDTKDSDLIDRIKRWESLDKNDQNQVAQELIKINSKDIDLFVQNLEKTATRYIANIYVLPLHGQTHEFKSIENAIDYILDYKSENSNFPVVRYEVRIRFNNSDQIEGQFKEKEDTIEFLRDFESPKLRPTR